MELSDATEKIPGNEEVEEEVENTGRNVGISSV
jgi:hypothetical protein